MLDWLIIGGGIHGVHLAARLLEEARVAPERLGILDPGPHLLHRWQACTQNTGMTHLRSPAVHHLDPDPWSLLRFAEENPEIEGEPPTVPLFVAPYGRPSLALFWAHSASVMSRYALAARQYRARATEIALRCSGVEVTLSGGETLEARQVLLALGAAEQPHWPDWAQALRAAGGRVLHLFAPGLHLNPEDLPERVAIVGAGISGAQAALRIAHTGRRVTLLSRHDLREHQFDSDPGWLGPRFLRGFHAEPRADVRRQMIREARHRGSMPPDVLHALKSAIQRGQIVHRVGAIQRATALDDQRLRLTVGYRIVTAGALILATGFDPTRPGGPLVARLAETYSLPCASCGYPQVDAALRWHPRVFVTGPLAELELGPAARNIAGARHAADRILPIAAAPPPARAPAASLG